MTDREAALTAALRDWRGSRFAWGQSDCLMSVLSYAAAFCGSDPGAPWRGRYRDEAGAAAILEQLGGVVPGLGGALAGAGFLRVEPARRGDIVVALLAGRQIGGLSLGDRLAFRIDGCGVLELAAGRVRVVAAWH